MANEKQLAILRQGVDVWNKWRMDNAFEDVDLREANLGKADLGGANLSRIILAGVDFSMANLSECDINGSDLRGAYLRRAKLIRTDFSQASLSKATLREADLSKADLSEVDLSEADLFAAMLSGVGLNRADLTYVNLSAADLSEADLTGAILQRACFNETNLSRAKFGQAKIGLTAFLNLSLATSLGLEKVRHFGPSTIGLDTLQISQGNIPEIFLKGCGLSDWEIENAKLYNPALMNDEIAKIQYRVFELRATQALQISPLFISYSHADSQFVDKLGGCLDEKGIRYWRDIHDMKAGRIEKQIDRAIRQNPTVLLILSKNSLSSDWVEHEARSARALEKDLGRDVLCPVALDDSWKDSHWPERIMEQIMEYNILDFSAWQDSNQFDKKFHKLIDGLELFYKG
jgi:uncharacterized protein YjbI with pentapeptide repeats